MVKIGGALATAPPAPAPRSDPRPRVAREPPAPRKPTIPDHVRAAFDLIYKSSAPRYEKARASGMLFALETIREWMESLK